MEGRHADASDALLQRSRPSQFALVIYTVRLAGGEVPKIACLLHHLSVDEKHTPGGLKKRALSTQLVVRRLFVREIPFLYLLEQIETSLLQCDHAPFE
jgi:hypothetical protein